ncbi:MAG: PAS domain S-box protein [Nitrospira sp.]|nr:PAS domain S-box protein [Nitrospira sp.]
MEKPRQQLVDLRRQAEQRLGRRIKDVVPSLPPESVTALVHELQVHQIELEMQCYELNRAQEELEESRDIYRELYESIPVGYITLDRDGRLYEVNPTGCALLNWYPKPHQLRLFHVFLSDSDTDRFSVFCRRVVSNQEPHREEFELRRSDGSAFFAALQAEPVRIGTGRGERLRLTFTDISDRKEAEARLHRQHLELEANRAELQALTRQLFTAQEDERKRIARELHDDYCQRVTALILEVNMLKKSCQGPVSYLAPGLTAMSQKLTDILNDFRTLSHTLLPRSLDDTSLDVPIRQLITEFSDHAGFEIHFSENAVPATLHSGVMTTMYRLLQESLCNIVKHANAKHVTVTLAGTGQGGIELMVADDGVGFDPTRAWDGQKGMGIVGMRERLRLVGGTIRLISQPGQGTTMIFRVPGQEPN